MLQGYYIILLNKAFKSFVWFPKNLFHKSEVWLGFTRLRNLLFMNLGHPLKIILLFSKRFKVSDLVVYRIFLAFKVLLAPTAFERSFSSLHCQSNLHGTFEDEISNWRSLEMTFLYTQVLDTYVQLVFDRAMVASLL